MRWFGTCTDIHDGKLMLEERKRGEADLRAAKEAEKAEMAAPSTSLAG